MALQPKRFNWVRSPGAWDRMQAWKQRRAAMQADFANASAVAVNAFSSASSTKIDGLAQLSAEAAAKRIQTEIGAAINKFA